MTAKTFHMAVLGRTLEHLGVQMYKRRDTAIAELVANCWDANATTVWVEAPDKETYDPDASRFVIEDDGIGMSDDDVENHYLIVGRNRRNAGDGEGTHDPGAQPEAPAVPTDPQPSRKIMGRKGIGKLAGFGIASLVELTSWRDGKATKLTLDMKKLKLGERDMREIEIPGEIIDVPPDVHCSGHGTRIVLHGLKHTTPIGVDALREALARRFSRTVRGLMTIYVNGDEVREPTIDWEYRVPEEGSREPDLEMDLGDNRIVRYRYGFSVSPLASREMRGFTILTNGKTAQAPPYFFDVEATASGQHGTKYLSGTVEADFLDAGHDDESDLVSTDRQEIDWESPETQDLLLWGAGLTRKALTDFRDYRKEKTRERVLANPDLSARLNRLDPPSKVRAEKLLGSIGLIETDDDKEIDLASSLLSAFEYQQFHDVVDQIESAEDNPEQLTLLLNSIESWKAMESRAILEVIRGRISIIEKFHSLIVNDAPETAPHVGDENLHDLLGDFPWLLHPEWQVLSEEKSISRQLRDWAQDDVAASLPAAEQRQRYDFLALGDQNKLVLIEIKRAAYAPDIDDIQRLVKYQANLEKGTDRQIEPVFISSKNFQERPETIERQPVKLLSWAEIHDRTKAYYEHYRALLERDTQNPDFAAKKAEVARAREVLETGAYRGEALRAAGLGPQDPIRSSLDETAVGVSADQTPDETGSAP
jgi:hypothetical protein